MKNISKIIDCETGDSFSKIIMNWTKITGNSNRDIMMPLKISNGTLVIAVPNGMVSKAAVRFKKKILENILNIAGSSGINDLKFVIDPKSFNIKRSEEKPEKKIIEISPEETAQKKKQLEEMGISPELSETFAKIELLWEKKNR